MQTPPLGSSDIYMKDTHCVEPNEKSIFRFLFSELWLILFTIFGDTPEFPNVLPIKINRSNVAKFTGKMRNVLKRMIN